MPTLTGWLGANGSNAKRNNLGDSFLLQKVGVIISEVFWNTNVVFSFRPVVWNTQEDDIFPSAYVTILIMDFHHVWE